MADITVFISAKCPNCQSFASTYSSWIEEDRKRTKVIVTNDLFDHTIQDLLDALHVDQLPSVLYEKEVYGGADAFKKMHELTGIECGKVAAPYGLASLRSRTCVNRILCA